MSSLPKLVALLSNTVFRWSVFVFSVLLPVLSSAQSSAEIHPSAESQVPAVVSTPVADVVVDIVPTAVSAVARSTGLPNQNAHLTQVFFGLLLVLTLVFAVAWFVKRVGQGALVGGQHMRVLASMPVGSRERIALIEVGGQQVLIGVAPGTINSLHVFEEPVIETGADREPSDFSRKIREIMTRGTIKQ